MTLSIEFSTDLRAFYTKVMISYNCAKSVQLRSYFWFVFSCIRTLYGDLLRKSPYSAWI